MQEEKKADEKRRLKIFVIDQEAMIALFREATTGDAETEYLVVPSIKEIPATAELISVDYDFGLRAFRFLFRDENFAIVPRGFEIPTQVLPELAYRNSLYQRDHCPH